MLMNIRIMVLTTLHFKEEATGFDLSFDFGKADSGLSCIPLRTSNAALLSAQKLKTAKRHLAVYKLPCKGTTHVTTLVIEGETYSWAWTDETVYAGPFQFRPYLTG